MLLPKVFRPLAAHPAPLSTSFTRLALPIRSRCMTTSTIQSSEQPTSNDIPPPTSSNPTESSTSTQTEPQSKIRLPYFVGRNNLNNLGVYHKQKQGGNLKITLLKHGDGDLRALKQDLKAALQLNDTDIAINNTTKHIVIRGHKKFNVLNFLNTMGF
ncbi:mitochondrial large subunit ribosomal protein-domain-containing protein [Hypoxylon trugodes]|uniref:mitochondrial large subunit ribosomal protein-domain-containing protein n=1 Tax=Hypoxylon trugodes TaxID=326681 RepID=UPI0021962654|nr:mitochondrial large subunit ribosomal protein-domain-containing protein [Hypoxylon trugodes]KAI1385958.1 mitochondrial large subunit ribosomal protein-domain-containing protein [Hypoxylon trugodes]